MPAFITRVELHGADGANYESLHREMRGRGFRRRVLSADRTQYDLPSAMYRFSGTDLTAKSVRDIAAEAPEARAGGSGFLLPNTCRLLGFFTLQTTRNDRQHTPRPLGRSV